MVYFLDRDGDSMTPAIIMLAIIVLESLCFYKILMTIYRMTLALAVVMVFLGVADSHAFTNYRKQAALRYDDRINEVESEMIRHIDNRARLYQLCQVKMQRLDEAVVFMEDNYTLFKQGSRAAGIYYEKRFEDCEKYREAKTQ